MAPRRHEQANGASVSDGVVLASHPDLGDHTLHCEGDPELLFTENESNASRRWRQPNASPYVKDAFHEYVVSGKRDAVNPSKTGTKAAAHYRLEGSDDQYVLVEKNGHRQKLMGNNEKLRPYVNH